MSSAGAVFVLLCISIAAANLPFLTSRILFVLRPARGDKSLAWRLFELAILYLVVGVLARILETQAYGSPYEQHWEFFAVTFCLFVVFAYPGFVYRYLWRKKA